MRQGSSQDRPIRSTCKVVRDEPPSLYDIRARSISSVCPDLSWVIRDYIYLAVERIAKIIGDFGYIKVKQQIAEFAEAAALAGNTHTELATIFVFII